MHLITKRVTSSLLIIVFFGMLMMPAQANNLRKENYAPTNLILVNAFYHEHPNGFWDKLRFNYRGNRLPLTNGQVTQLVRNALTSTIQTPEKIKVTSEEQYGSYFDRENEERKMVLLYANITYWRDEEALKRSENGIFIIEIKHKRGTRDVASKEAVKEVVLPSLEVPIPKNLARIEDVLYVALQKFLNEKFSLYFNCANGGSCSGAE